MSRAWHRTWLEETGRAGRLSRRPGQAGGPPAVPPRVVLANDSIGGGPLGVRGRSDEHSPLGRGWLSSELDCHLPFLRSTIQSQCHVVAGLLPCKDVAQIIGGAKRVRVGRNQEVAA